MHTRDLWTLAALLYGALLTTIGFAPSKATRRSLPRFVIDDIVARVRPLEALVRRLLFAQARSITVTLRARAPSPSRPPLAAPVTQIITLPHDPLAWRRMMLGDTDLARLCPRHPLDGDPTSWKHVRFCVGAGDYPKRPDPPPSNAHPVAEKRRHLRLQACRPTQRAPEGARSGRTRSNSIPWYKLTAAEKELRRQHRAARNVESELRKERAEKLAALSTPERVLSPADFALAPTTTLARRLEALVRVICDPAPYARRIARKLAAKPALAAKLAKRVARKTKRHVSETFVAAVRWMEPALAAAHADTS